VIRVWGLVALLALPPAFNRWFGADKLKHFLMSALVQSAGFSTARTVGLDRAPSQVIGGAAVLAIGLWKERQDRRTKKPFSVEDLVWDAAGGAAAGALLNGTRGTR
jgi:uncharacterized protein YfiM (DUF2279 family)